MKNAAREPVLPVKATVAGVVYVYSIEGVPGVKIACTLQGRLAQPYR